MAEHKTDHTNRSLSAWMTDHEMTVEELATAVNEAIGVITGRVGALSERTVYRWLSAESQSPQTLQRRALEMITGLTMGALGFRPRGKKATTIEPASDEDSDVRRRQIFGAAAGTAAAALPFAPPVRPSRVGTSDVIRLRVDVERLVALDADRGGHGLEQAALGGATEALALQKLSSTQRVRQRLFALAADFTSTAAWSLIDAGALDGAGHHLDRALTLAGLAQDSEMAMQVWNLRAMLARQRRDYPESVAASRAAQATAVARRSPLHASLAQARTAVGYAYSGDTRAALGSLGRAEDALAKADPDQPAAPWIAFYGPAELHSLTAVVQDVVGRPAQAEAASHRALGALPTTYRRNRALATAHLALAQLHQGDVEQACSTSDHVFATMVGAPLPGRVRQVLGDFQRELIARTASAKIAQEWTDRHRTEWSST